MVNPTPLRMSSSSNYTNPPRPNILTADPDIVMIAPDALPVEVQAQLILQDMGGVELIMFSRHDTVNGQSIAYQPIKDLDLLATTYGSQRITGYVPTFMSFKKGFSIDLDNLEIDSRPLSPGSIYVNTNASGVGSEIIVDLVGLSDTNVVEIAIGIPELNEILSIDTGPLLGGEVYGNFDGDVDGGNSLGYNIDITTDGGGA